MYKREKAILSVQGTFQNGVVHPNEPIEGHEGQSVIIVFVKENRLGCRDVALLGCRDVALLGCRDVALLGCRDVALQRLYKDFEITQNYFSYRNQQRPLMKVFVFTSAWIAQAFTSDRHFGQAGFTKLL